ncbi:MAG: hypothetical protein WD068_02380, partial [Candidatus Babeliales bacterium]
MKKILILIASVCAILPAGAEQETQKIKSPIYRLTDDGVQEPVYFDDQTRSLGSLQLNSNISGITLSVPGTYILANNFTLTSPISITGDTISFDLNGFTISGAGTPGADSLVNVTSVNNVTIKNGTVKNGPRSGILLTSASEVTVENVSSNNNNYAG